MKRDPKPDPLALVEVAARVPAPVRTADEEDEGVFFAALAAENNRATTPPKRYDGEASGSNFGEYIPPELAEDVD